MKDYKKWTERDRRKSLRKTNEAIKAGIIPKPSRCARCGGIRGVHYHNHDYSDPIKHLEALCSKCHLKEHREERTKQLKFWKEG